VQGRELVRPLAVSLRHHAIRQTGAIVGTRADRVPRPVRRLLSLEGRDSFTPYDVPASPLLAQTTQPDSRPVELTDRWAWDFAARSRPLRPVTTEPHSGDAEGPWRLAWVVPPWRVGSGGHTTIFRLIRQLELRGHRSVIHVFDPFGHNHHRGSVLRREIRERFVEVDAEVFVGLEDFDSADVAIATEWTTAFPVRDLPRCREKAYLVQDHEPEFFATSAQSIWAEETYAMGYRCIAYTPWMADVLRERYGIADARWFECGTDLDVFAFAGDEDRREEVVAVYARRETERRAVDLAMAGLAVLAERRPTLRPVLFGSRQKAKLPFAAEDLGVVAPARLAQLYREAMVGIVFSLTTHSLVAHEMMASGLPVVELEGENVGSALGASGDLVELSRRTPDAIADAVERLLDDRAHAAAMAARARAFVEQRDWTRAGDQVEGALRAFLASPRRA
jgi:glycosyltransferase involved in cell wall biosynthesis